LLLYRDSNKPTTAANTIFLQSTAPQWILLAAPFVLGERILRRDVVFMLAIAGGLALFFVDENQGVATAPDPFLGNVLASASGVCWAITVMGLRWLGREGGTGGTDGAGGRGGRGALGAVLAGNTLAFAVCVTLALPLDGVRGVDLAIVGYLGVFQIGLAYVFVTSALRVLPAFESALILLVEPVLNPIWAWILHGERPGPWAMTGAAVLVGAMIVKTLADARNTARASRAAARPT
jgi:drug/metabolite transporter (DMT)-like permease